MEWMTDAACRDQDTDVFFQEVARGVFREQADARAKAFCASCPVVEECLAYAQQRNINYGVWGGLIPSERRTLKRRRQASPAARSKMSSSTTRIAR